MSKRNFWLYIRFRSLEDFYNNFELIYNEPSFFTSTEFIFPVEHILAVALSIAEKEKISSYKKLNILYSKVGYFISSPSNTEYDPDAITRWLNFVNSYEISAEQESLAKTIKETYLSGLT